MDESNVQAPPTFTEIAGFEAEFEKSNFGLSGDEKAAVLLYARNLSGQGLPILINAEYVSKWLGWESGFLYGISNRSSQFYRQYSIPKKAGGARVISEPLPALKEIQRKINQDLLQKVPIGRAAHAYTNGATIKKNARFHLKQAQLLKMDIKDFFPSIGFKTVFRLFSQLGYADEVAGLLTGICVKEDELPQGAPTSPSISNIVMKQFDEELLTYFSLNRKRYTRYADDIAVSGHHVGAADIRLVAAECEKRGFKVNWKKTRIFRDGASKVVTGVLASTRLRGETTARRRLRQEYYYVMTYGLTGHAFKIGERPSLVLRRLLGTVNHFIWIDPKDLQLLRIQRGLMDLKKSGDDFISFDIEPPPKLRGPDQPAGARSD